VDAFQRPGLIENDAISEQAWPVKHEAVVMKEAE
jgi:hypothetical protein